MRVIAAWLAATNDGPHRKLTDQPALEALHQAIRDMAPVRDQLREPHGLTIAFDHGTVTLAGVSGTGHKLTRAVLTDVRWSDTAVILSFTHRRVRTKTITLTADAVRTNPMFRRSDDLNHLRWDVL